MLSKAHAINWYPGWLWLNLGWYPGEAFALLDVTIGETSDTYGIDKVDHVTIFSLQVTFFMFAFGWRKLDD